MGVQKYMVPQKLPILGDSARARARARARAQMGLLSQFSS